MCVVQQIAAAVLDSLTPACMMRCTSTLTRRKRTRQVSVNVSPVTCHYCGSGSRLYGNTGILSLLLLQVAPPAGGGDSGPYRPMMSCCTTLMRTTGTRPGWTPGGDSESLKLSNIFFSSHVTPQVSSLWSRSPSACAGTTAECDFLRGHRGSPAKLRVSPAAMPSSTVLPA